MPSTLTPSEISKWRLRKQKLSGIELALQMSLSFSQFQHVGSTVPVYIVFIILSSFSSFAQLQSNLPVPHNSRVFVIHYWDAALIDFSVTVQFRWSPPFALEDFGLSYFEVLIDKVTFREYIRLHELEYELYGAPKHSILNFQVRACSLISCGPFTDPVIANTSVENRPATLIIVDADGAKLYLPDTRSLIPLLNESIVALSLVTYDDSIYWIENDTWQLSIGRGNSKETLISLKNPAVNMVVDWTGRYLFWLEKSDHWNYLQKYDLSRPSSEPVTIILTNEITNGTLLHIQVDPFHSFVYYTLRASNESTISLIRSAYDVQKVDVIMGSNHYNQSHLTKGCNCSLLSLHHIFVVDSDQNVVRNISIYVIDAETWNIYGLDKDGSYCTIILNSSSSKWQWGSSVISMTVDKKRLYWIEDESRNTIFSINKFTGDDFIVESNISFSMSFILAYNVLPLPVRDCLIIKNINNTVSLLNSTAHTLTLQLPSSISIGQPCGALSVPSVCFYLEYSHKESSVIQRTQCNYESVVALSGLKAYTFYQIRIGAGNYFVNLWKNHSLSSPVLLQTKPGIPSSPLSVMINVLTANVIDVQWLVPSAPNGKLSEIVYVVEWEADNEDGSKSNGTEWMWSPGPGKYLTKMIKELNESKVYNVQVLAYDRDLTGHSMSSTAMAKTFQLPEPAHLLLATVDSLLFSWTSPNDSSVVKFALEFAKVDKDFQELVWLMQGQRLHVGGSEKQFNITISHLESDQPYAIRVEVIYRSHQPYTWPTVNFTIVRTLSGQIGPPGIPFLVPRSKEDSRYLVEWKVPDHLMDSLDGYQLMCGHPDLDGNIAVVYEGLDSFWPVTGYTHNTSYVCHVRARNRYGWGPFSNWSLVFQFQPVSAGFEAGQAEALRLILIPVISILVVILCVSFFIFACFKYSHKFQLFNTNSMKFARPVTEEYHLQSSTDDESRKYYAINSVVSASEEVFSQLPHFDRNKVTPVKFIAERSNGDIFEGFAYDILGDKTGPTPIILRTINSNELGEQEIEEQMKEAALMNQIRHKNIISLLGVCLGGEPQFLIFELATHGDFLTFLHLHKMKQEFSVISLLKFCQDIVSGCQFFEERHLVHRDLSAQNCFVFCLTSSSWIIKIGGFCLLKDIYRCQMNKLPNNKLVPAKWMAPEAALDRMFTNMSDVWAFGILMWEIFTMGEDPYSDLSNEMEVLQFVREGGRLIQPKSCPLEIYNCMLSCWRSSPFRRPSFHLLADRLQKTYQRLNASSSSLQSKL